MNDTDISTGAKVTETEGSKPIVVVVGVDGSTQSYAALRWADRYAGTIGGELRAVIAWEHTPGFGYVPVGQLGLEHEARKTIEHAIEKTLGATRVGEVTAIVRHGNPTPVLVEESNDAAVLVVGDRGYGGFAGLLLGSVGENCVRRAKCTVVVVRDKG
jgi:nucleotide-binding universal stress UspA family protein